MHEHALKMINDVPTKRVCTIGPEYLCGDAVDEGSMQGLMPVGLGCISEDSDATSQDVLWPIRNCFSSLNCSSTTISSSPTIRH